MDWYYESDGETMGPVSADLIARYLDTGHLSADSLVWQDGMDDWVTAGTVFGARDVDRSTFVGDYHGTGDPRRLHRDQLAGFWIRVAASFLDGVILTAAYFAVAATAWAVVIAVFQKNEIVSLLVGLMLLVSAVMITPLLESSSWQGTPGKRILGLEVVGPQGERIGLGRAFGRNLGKGVSSFLLCIGHAMFGWTEHRQGLHDMIADTFVVRR